MVRQIGRSNDLLIAEITIELKKAQLIFIRHARKCRPQKPRKISTKFRKFLKCQVIVIKANLSHRKRLATVLNVINEPVFDNKALWAVIRDDRGRTVSNKVRNLSYDFVVL